MSASYNNGTVTFSPGEYFDTLVDTNGTMTILPVKVVENFTASDYIDLQTYPAPPYPTPIGPVQIVSAAQNAVIDGVTFVGDSNGFYYEAAGDTQGGEAVEAINYPNGECLAAGTRIGTPDGERTVERLGAGDLVLCHAGGAPIARPVVARHVWRCDPAAAADPVRRGIAPIRIAAGAFGPATPQRELVISPNHAVFADGILVPARYLINGLSIVQDARSGRIEYVHLEVAGHDLVAAEGLLVETRLPGAAAAQGATHAGGWSQLWEAHGCAPLVVCGPALDRLRARLFERAASGQLFATQPWAAALPGTGAAAAAVRQRPAAGQLSAA